MAIKTNIRYGTEASLVSSKQKTKLQLVINVIKTHTQSCPIERERSWVVSTQNSKVEGLSRLYVKNDNQTGKLSMLP